MRRAGSPLAEGIASRGGCVVDVGVAGQYVVGTSLVVAARVPSCAGADEAATTREVAAVAASRRI